MLFNQDLPNGSSLAVAGEDPSDNSTENTVSAACVYALLRRFITKSCEKFGASQPGLGTGSKM
jgi:hypothetical protein